MKKNNGIYSYLQVDNRPRKRKVQSLYYNTARALLSPSLESGVVTIVDLPSLALLDGSSYSRMAEQGLTIGRYYAYENNCSIIQRLRKAKRPSFVYLRNANIINALWQASKQPSTRERWGSNGVHLFNLDFCQTITPNEAYWIAEGISVTAAEQCIAIITYSPRCNFSQKASVTIDNNMRRIGFNKIFDQGYRDTAPMKSCMYFRSNS